MVKMGRLLPLIGMLDMLTKTLPPLVGRAKEGKIKVWNIAVHQKAGEPPYIITRHGYLDGAIQETSKRITSGKNLGKRNQTTPFEQALHEAKSKWMKQFDKGYRESIEELTDVPNLPMLALKYEDRKHKLKWPVYAQPKLNGVRCTIAIKDGKVSFTSRNGKHYSTLNHLIDELLKIFGTDDRVYDGEVFHPDLSLQQILMRVKRVKTDRSDIDDVTLQYWIYDIADTNDPFSVRYDFLLRHYFRLMDSNTLKPVTTVLVNNEAELIKFDELQRSLGFEGSMVRSLDGAYIPSYRSPDLLKYKVCTFVEDDYVVVGGTSATGKDEGTVIFTCRADNGLLFSVRPKGTHYRRSEMLANIHNYQGRKLTVKHAGLTADGIPFHPVGLFFRDEFE